ncbi:MAG: hypothetical protein ACPIOQ_19620, partial [Promethearchaeia archaeon]
ADLLAESAGIESAEFLESIHQRKTARLLAASLEIGAAVASASLSQAQQRVCSCSSVAAAVRRQQDSDFASAGPQ